MDTCSKALQIVLCETNNHVLQENSKLKDDVRIFQNILCSVTKTESLLSKILELVDLENSYKLHEAIIDDDFFKKRCKNKYSYRDLEKILHQLQYLGFYIVVANEKEIERYNDYLYISWGSYLCPMEKEIALRYNKKIYYPKYNYCLNY